MRLKLLGREGWLPDYWKINGIARKEMIITIIVASILLVLSVMVLVSKLVESSYGPFGLLVMLANVPYETLTKKFRIQRITADALALVVISSGWWMLSGAVAAVIFAMLFSLAWAYALHLDGQAVRSTPGEEDKRFIGQIPMPHPRIIVMLNGPVWSWGRVCDLGDWPAGRVVKYELIVLNPTVIEPQLPMSIKLLSAPDKRITIEGIAEGAVSAPAPGGVVRIAFSLTSKELSDKPIDIALAVAVGTFQVEKRLRIRSVFDLAKSGISKVDINRWQGGALAGFAWRGDMDLYDPATFQSVEGLRWVLDLCARFRIASTLFLSGRLSLDKPEHKKFCDYLGVDRKTEEIDEFIRFMKEEVTIGHKLDFPYTTPHRYALELGNHMYLHYGTHAAMAEENGWKNRSRMLAGRYSWQSTEEGSFAEQRDNALKNVEVIKNTIGFQVKTWGVPGRDYDEATPRAVEASGMAVGSDTNASGFTNVLRLPPPHHPKGCDRLVELTKKYPGDPDNVFKLAMLKYWLWLAAIRRSTFVYMAHHHLLRYEGMACTGMTETFLRFVMERGGGMYYISTLYGLGSYWEKVLCPLHRCVAAKIINKREVQVINSGDTLIESIPVEVRFSDGKRMVVLADLPATGSINVSVAG